MAGRDARPTGRTADDRLESLSYPLPQLKRLSIFVTVRFVHRTGPLKSHPERRLPERRIYAQRFDFAWASNRKSLRVDPSTALGAGAPRLLRMTLRETCDRQDTLRFQKSTVSSCGR